MFALLERPTQKQAAALDLDSLPSYILPATKEAPRKQMIRKQIIAYKTRPLNQCCSDSRPYAYWPCRSFNRKSFQPNDIEAIYRKEALRILRKQDKTAFYAAMYGDEKAGQWLRDLMHCLYGMPL